MSALKYERRQETQHCLAGAVDEDAPLEHLSDDQLGKLRRVEFRCNHQAFTANVGDRFMAGGGGAEGLLGGKANRRGRCLASSGESSSAATIRPLPRTSVIASWRVASERSCCWK